jgi:CheY-like chemotaxis protein
VHLKILTCPTVAIDDVPIDQLQVGRVHEFATDVAARLLAEGWAERVPDGEAPEPRQLPVVRPVGPVVLVVDDEPDIRHFTELLLIAHGYRVVVAGHGRDAIDRLREQRPDLILLDLNMPVMDGWQFRAEQRYFLDKERAAVPVLLMTGSDDAATHVETLRAVGVIRKPVDLDTLLGAVSAAIGSPRALRPRQDPVGLTEER